MALRCPEELIGKLDTSLLPEGSLSGNLHWCRKPAVLHCSGVCGMTAPRSSPLAHRGNGSSGSPGRFVSIVNHLRRAEVQEAYPADPFSSRIHATACHIDRAVRRADPPRARTARLRMFGRTSFETRETFRENRSAHA